LAPPGLGRQGRMENEERRRERCQQSRVMSVVLHSAFFILH
jgi:hypothetical protein